MGPQQTLEQIRSQPKGRESFKNLVRRLGLKGAERAELQIALDELVAEGKLIENRRGHYKVAGKESGFHAGRFSQHPKGFGFVMLDRAVAGVDGDVYISPDSTADAMHDDRVLVRITRIGPDGRAEGSIRQILYRAQSLVVGKFFFHKQGCRVEPHDERVQGRIEIIPGKEVPPGKAFGERLGNVKPPRVREASEMDGMIVTVALTEFPTRFRPARGRVVEVLGDQDDFGVDVEVMIRKHHLPYRFSEESLEEAQAIPDEVSAADIAGRRDFRELPIVTIDGETARDFDDAVHVEKTADGYKLQVHIADVSHYVRPGSEIDREARIRGTSAYFPDRAVPMLPGKLSTEVCSLKPDVDRLTLSALLTLDARGEITAAEFCRGVIRSARRMTYTKVFRILEGDADLRAEHGPLCERFELMQELAEILIEKRRKRGAVDLDLPEAEIVFDEEGRMTGVKKSERTIAHRLIEEFMLAANEAVARQLSSAGYLFLHRIHETPSPKGVREFEEIARTFGHSLGVEISERSFGRSRKRRDGSKPFRESKAERGVSVTSKDYQRLAEKIKGLPEERVLSYRLLRSLKQARYSEEQKGHFALATDFYLHFTSPIRRYPDLIVHRVLGAWLDRRSKKTPYAEGDGPYSLEELAQLADETSLYERRAQQAERELLDWKKSKFLEGRLGDEFDGLIVSVTERGLWVELQDLFVEGFVPLDSFLTESFYYRENMRALVGSRSKRKYKMGDRVRVRLDRIAWDRLRPEFACLDYAESKT